MWVSNGYSPVCSQGKILCVRWYCVGMLLLKPSRSRLSSSFDEVRCSILWKGSSPFWSINWFDLRVKFYILWHHVVSYGTIFENLILLDRQLIKHNIPQTPNTKGTWGPRGPLIPRPVPTEPTGNSARSHCNKNSFLIYLFLCCLLFERNFWVY